MARWRKRPLAIDAVQMPESPGYADTFAMAPQWLHDAMLAGHVLPCTAPNWRIKTLEGVMICRPGDWIIQGVKGELYPCKPDIFAATYEPLHPAEIQHD